MSGPGSSVTTALNTGRSNYAAKSAPIKPKPTFQQHTSQSYHAAKQFNSNHVDTMRMLGKGYKANR